MFDTITGLPVHPLVVHAVVILLPLACLATIAVSARAPWRRFAPYLIALNGVVMLAAFAAKESGEQLEHRLRSIGPLPDGFEDHAEWGDRLFLLAVALFIGAIVLWAVRAKTMLANIVAVAAVVGCLATIGVTVVVGHSGATAVWKDTIANTKVTGGGED